MNAIPSRVATRLGEYLARTCLKENVRPFPYQLACLTWMLFRETHEWYGVLGGVNGQAMGLGKTLQMLLLVLVDRMLTRQTPCTNDRQEQDAYCAWQELRSHSDVPQHPATLVLISKESKRAWLHTIEARFRPGTFRHATVKSLKDLTTLSHDLDLVFLSTGLITYKNMPAPEDFPYKFRRLIYDEAHENANPDTALARGVNMLPAVFHWVMTASMITNSLSDAMTILHTTLHLQEPLLLKWASNANPVTSVSGLYKEGIDLNYIGCLLLGLCLVRPRMLNEDPTSIHETSPADLYSWLTAVPPSAGIALTTLIRYPTLAWELAELTSERGRHVRDFYSDKVQREKPPGYLRDGRDNVAALQMCTDFGVTLPSGDDGVTTTPQQVLLSAGNAYHTAYANNPISPQRILLRLKLFSADKLSPSHARLKTLAHVESLFASYRETQRVYSALANGIGKYQMDIISKRSALASSLPASIRLPIKKVDFFRQASHPLEQAALQHLNELYVQAYANNNTAAAAAEMADPLSPLNIPTFAREIAFHMDLLLLTQNERAMEIFRGCPPVRDYYEKTWALAKKQPGKHLEWIAKTAWTRMISTKLRMMAEYWVHSVHRGERLLSFSFFIGALHIQEAFFTDRLGVSCRVLTGSDNGDTRARVLAEMASPNGPRILFAAEQCFAQSGNMEFANHVWHPFAWWNKRHENQADGRPDRPGQTRQIYSSAFLLSNSIDELVRKRAEAKELLSGVTQQQHTSTTSTVELYTDKTALPVSVLRVAAEPDLYKDNYTTTQKQQQQVAATTSTSMKSTTFTTREIERTHQRWLMQANRALIRNISLAPLAELDACDLATINAQLKKLPTQWNISCMSLTPVDDTGIQQQQPPPPPPQTRETHRHTPRGRSSSLVTHASGPLLDSILNAINDSGTIATTTRTSVTQTPVQIAGSSDMEFLAQELRRITTQSL